MIRKTINESVDSRLLLKRKELINNNIVNIKDNSLYKRIKSKYETFEENDLFKETYPTYKDFEEYIINAIDNGNIYITLEFAKNTARQNYFELVQIDELVEILKQNGLELTLKKINNKEYFINNDGEIVHTNPQNGTKSLDLVGECNGYEIYGTCKYIKGHGGSQDNQFNDVMATNKCFIEIENKRKNKNKNIITISLCDGKYFMKKMDKLIKYRTRNNFPGTTEEVAQFLINRLK